MPQKLERILSWYATRKCWRKTYRGRSYYLATGGACKGEDDADGYMAAIAEWHALKQRLDSGEPPASKPVSAFSGVSALPPAGASRPLDVRLPVKSLGGAIDPFQTIDPAILRNAMGFAYDYSREPDLPPATVLDVPDLTLSELVADFADDFKQRAETGDCSIRMFAEIRDTLADFRGYCDRYGIERIDGVTEHFLKTYRDKQRELVLAGANGPHTARKRLANLKRFIEWAYKHRYLPEMPRNVDRNFAKAVRLPDPTPNPLTIEQVRAVWQAAITKHKFARKDYRTAVYILLGLNCGYRSGDISALKWSHLRQEDGRWIIDRKREKTGSPQVHRLWPLTAELLFAEATDRERHENVLLDERGGLLVTEQVENKTTVNDCIGRAFGRLRAKLKWTGTGTGHSSLRDTGADAIKKQFPAMPHVVSQYLGHKPSGVMRHYTREHYGPLFESLDWLDGYFGLKL